MVYIETNENTQVVYQHFMPFDSVYGLGKTEEELLQTGYLVESVPEYTEEIPSGKSAELHYDGAEFSWVLVDVPEEPETLENRINKLEIQQAATDSAVLGLMNMMLGM